MEDVSFISWVQNPDDKQDGLVVVNDGFWHELPERFKSDLIQYFKELIKETHGK
jgi:hypothetical protein